MSIIKANQVNVYENTVAEITIDTDNGDVTVTFLDVGLEEDDPSRVYSVITLNPQALLFMAAAQTDATLKNADLFS